MAFTLAHLALKSSPLSFPKASYCGVKDMTYLKVWPIVVSDLVFVQEKQSPFENLVDHTILITILHLNAGESTTIN